MNESETKDMSRGEESERMKSDSKFALIVSSVNANK